MAINNQLLFRAIQIAQSNPQNFGCTLLKERLHICTRESNEILQALNKLGIIEMQIVPTYKMHVKI